MPLVPLLSALGTFFLGLGYFIHSLTEAGLFQWLGSIEWSAIFNWFHSAPAVFPPLSFGNEHSRFQQFMDMQFQIGELKRQMLTMPALPTEGF